MGVVSCQWLVVSGAPSPVIPAKAGIQRVANAIDEPKNAAKARLTA